MHLSHDVLWHICPHKKNTNKVLFESNMKLGKVEKDKSFLEIYKKWKILEGTKQQDYYSLKKNAIILSSLYVIGGWNNLGLNELGKIL